LYRPFDIRFIFYHDSVVWRTRKEVMQHMMRENLGLITSRRMAESKAVPVFITNILTDVNFLTSAFSVSYFFPLYLYYSSNKNHMFEKEENKKVPNIKEGKIFWDASKRYNKEVTPEEILYYIYGVYIQTFTEKSTLSF